MKCLITSATLMGGKWILEKYPNLNNYQPSIDECFIYNYIFDGFGTQDVIIVEINDIKNKNEKNQSDKDTANLSSAKEKLLEKSENEDKTDDK